MSRDNPLTPRAKYCPNCDGEFVLTLDTCPDCGVALTATPPVEPAHPEPVEVFSSADRTLLPLARATLRDAGIEHQELERDLSSAIMGSIEHETVLYVGPDDADRAVALLEELAEGNPQLPY